MAKLFLLVTSSIFFLYGLWFVTFPQEALQFVVQSKAGSSSGVTDLRATYGGMAIGVGLILNILANAQRTINLGLWAVFLLMLSMALSRTIGMVIDGEPYHFMYIYLNPELLASIFSLRLLRTAQQKWLD